MCLSECTPSNVPPLSSHCVLCEEDFDEANGDIHLESEEATPPIPPPPLAVNDISPGSGREQTQLNEEAYVVLRQQMETSQAPGLAEWIENCRLVSHFSLHAVRFTEGCQWHLQLIWKIQTVDPFWLPASYKCISFWSKENGKCLYHLVFLFRNNIPDWNNTAVVNMAGVLLC